MIPGCNSVPEDRTLTPHTGERSDPLGAASERLSFVFQVPSDVHHIEQIVTELVHHCRAFEFSGSRLSLNLRVGVSEALSNAMLYGNERDPSKHVRLEVSLDRTRIALYIIDEGNGFDPEAVPDPTLPGNLDRPGGRGLFLLRELMDEVEYNERGNAVRLVLHRTRNDRHAADE